MEIPELFLPKMKFIQETIAAFPVIVLGSGYSASFGVPSMEELANHLKMAIPPKLPDEEKKEWGKLEKAIEASSLEGALQKMRISKILLELVVDETWKCIFPRDAELLQKIIDQSVEIPLTRLLTHLFRSTHERVSLVTTNYDRLAEYSVDYAGYDWTAGFEYGYIGDKQSSKEYAIVKNGYLTRIVDIWKVHGSLDWYRRADGSVYFLPSVVNLPNGFQPVIVTPGIEKYRITHEEPFRSIISGADAAIDAGNSFICVGYGFNDEHIQPKLLDRCKRQGKNIVVITKHLTQSAKKVLIDGKCPNFLALEKSGDDTRMYSPENPKGKDIGVPNLWILGNLLDTVL